MRSDRSHRALRFARVLALLGASTGFAVAALTQSPAPVADDAAGAPAILFVTQPPLAADYGSRTSVFGNHIGKTTLVPRGGDLVIRYSDGTLRNLTQEAGFGINPAEQIAVREPTVHWSGNRALFSMVIGGTTKNDFAPVYWQIYEVSGLKKGETVKIKKLRQPAGCNNVAPLYGPSGRILFVSDLPRTGEPAALPQLDEYESVATSTGIWSMDAKGGDLTLLDNAVSGAFTPILASDGRIVYTRWDHLQRDQQNVPQFGNFGAFNYASESSDVKLPSNVEHFPEPVLPEPTSQVPSYSLSVFFPWQMNEDGTGVETLNHLGRHELLGFVPTAKVTLPSFYKPGVNTIKQTFLHIKESPVTPGLFFATNAQEFSTHSAGQIVAVHAPEEANAEDISIVYVTDPLSATGTQPGKTPPAGHPGLFRSALPLSDGSLIAVRSTSPFVESPTGPGPFDSSFDFHLTKLVKSGPYYVPAGRLLPNGFVKNVSYFDALLNKQVTYTGRQWELDPVEVVARPRPPRHVSSLPEIETRVLLDVLGPGGVKSLRKYLRAHRLALVTSRNVTLRADKQQEFNLRVPGGVTTALPTATPVDVAFLQFFQGDLLRGYHNFNQGRRVLPVPMHDGSLPVVPGAPKGAARLGGDGSMAALVPSGRALAWQLTGPDGSPVVRERYWVTFAAGEMRSCTNCHAINKTDVVLGQGPPQNPPKALRDLAVWWKNVTGGGTVGDTIGVYNATLNRLTLRNENTAGSPDVAFNVSAYQSGWIPVAGDWNGDGVDTIGFYVPATATFYLSNSNGPGPFDVVFTFGTPGVLAIPIAGDWDGDGVDTIGLYEIGTGHFRLRNFNASGPADVSFSFGPAGSFPVAGDWNGDGRDSIGVYVPPTGNWLLRNQNSAGPPHLTISFPSPAVKFWPIAGDWNADGVTTLGFYDEPKGTFYLRATNGAQSPVQSFPFGPSPAGFPVIGDWNGG